LHRELVINTATISASKEFPDRISRRRVYSKYSSSLYGYLDVHSRETQFMKIKSALRQARELRGWSQARVAQAINADVGTVSRWERHITAPSPYFREQLCQLFDMDARALGFLESEGFVQEETQFAEYEQSGAFFTPTQEGPIIDPLIPRPVLTYTPLVGRDALLKHLISLLCSGTTCALFGLPGVGKTALALTLVHHQTIRSHFSDGVLWVGLGPSPDIHNCLLHWATLLGVPAPMLAEHHTTESLSRILRQAIGRRRLLLVIDDAWTVDESFPFLVGGPHCAQLVTTRSPQLAHTIAGHMSISVPVLSHQESFHLLATLVPDLMQIDDTQISPLIQQVGGLPFLLYLIGKNLQVEARSGQFRRLYSTLSHLSERSARLQLSFPLAPTERPPALTEEVPPSLETLIAMSDRHISSAAHDGLLSLSLLPTHPASFSEETALAVAAVSVDILDELLDAGLLESRHSGRYTLHQTIADYILHHGQPTREARERLISHCHEYILAHKDDTVALELECPVILKALEEAYLLQHHRTLIHGTCAIIEFLCNQEMYAIAERCLSNALTSANSMTDLRSKGLILYHQGNLANLQGKRSQAHTCYEEGFQLARQVQDYELQKKLLRRLGKTIFGSRSSASAKTSVEVSMRGGTSVEVSYIQCPFCKDIATQKRGKTNAGTQRYYCRNCRRSFVIR
jgi:transcriptional regulator with XRE-family HTH domain/tetratricopeptide (TPR) repeat protein